MLYKEPDIFFDESEVLVASFLRIVDSVLKSLLLLFFTFLKYKANLGII
jgi:hypothetical protein